jgi:hypothetical protein
MRRITWLAAGMVLGAVMFQGARMMRRHAISSHLLVATAHAHGHGPDWSAMSNADLEIARVFLIERHEGVRAAFDTLSALAHRDRQVAALGEAGLHQVAHSLGRYAATRMSDGVNSFRECVPGFLSGCPHGVIEGYFESHPASDPASLRGLCDRIAPATPAQWQRECAHGVGHGLFQDSGGDVTASIEKCRGFSGSTMQRECLDGVFMSAVQRDVEPGPQKNSPGPRCREYDGDKEAACWYYEAVFLLSRHHNDPLAAIRDCPQSPENAASSCARGFGHQSAGMLTTNYARVADVCRAANRNAASCIEGAVATYTSETWTADEANTFCAEWTGDLRRACDAAVAAEMKLKS